MSAPPNAPSQTGLAVNQPLNHLRDFFDKPNVIDTVAKAIPEKCGLTPKRLLAQTLTLAATFPKLLECSPRSIVLGVVKAAELGLELAGPLGHAYLVPRWDNKKRCVEATFQIGWKGLVNLAFRSGMVKVIHCRAVKEKDAFDFELGTGPHITHKPSLEQDPGEATFYYCVAHLITPGAVDFEVMSRGQVEAHRQKYSPPPQGKQDYSAWATAFDDMALKTVVRKLCKRLPLSPDAVSAAVEDEYQEAGLTLPKEVRPRTEAITEKLDVMFPESAGDGAGEVGEPQASEG